MTGAAPGVQKTWARSAPVCPEKSKDFFFSKFERVERVEGTVFFCFSLLLFSFFFSPLSSSYPQRRHRSEKGRARVLAAAPDDGDAPCLALAARTWFRFFVFFFFRGE